MRGRTEELAAPALLTDLYELTMAYAYWRSGAGRQDAAFNLTFRAQPFGGGYTVACGTSAVVEFIERWRFTDDDLAYLRDLPSGDGTRLFPRAFLDALRAMRIDCDVDIVPEGTVVFPHEPLVRVRGPIIQGQLLESALLNIVNFQSLVATKAARICQAAAGDEVIEFGLRRAQGVDGALSASRAAHVGGCASTSNTLAGNRYGIPVRGTHAHSWVMSFPTEREAFDAYARALPGNVVFLVDTYDTLAGVRRAVEAGRDLRARGHELGGIRLDSGDLAYLSVRAREILDDGGFPDARIVASNDLDEHIITSLKAQGAPITVWGVGTKLVTGDDQPSLGGVYKLTAVREPGGEWEPRVKLSEQLIKITTPGMLQVRRFERDGEFAGDMIYDELHPPRAPYVIVDPSDPTRRKRFRSSDVATELLVPAFRGGKRVYEPPPIAESRARTQRQLDGFHAGVKRLVYPHQYPAGLELGVHERKTALVLRSRNLDDDREASEAER